MEATADREKVYLERWQGQKDYYSKRSAQNKKWYIGLQLFIGIGAVVVPVLLAISDVPRFIPTILSGLVALATVVENVRHHGECWRRYRVTCEALKREKALYMARAGSYRHNRTDNPLELFAERCEAVINEETDRYFDTVMNADKKKEGQEPAQPGAVR